MPLTQSRKRPRMNAQAPNQRAALVAGRPRYLHVGRHWPGPSALSLDGKTAHMKKCTWCGKEQTDEATVCEFDGQPLVEPPATKPQPPADSSQRSNKGVRSAVAIPPASPRQACPRCGGRVQTLDKPWIGSVAVPVMFYGGFVAIFAVGAALGTTVLLWPVSCPNCGRLRLRDLPSKVRSSIILKKSFVALLLILILSSTYACIIAWREIQPH